MRVCSQFCTQKENLRKHLIFKHTEECASLLQNERVRKFVHAKIIGDLDHGKGPIVRKPFSEKNALKKQD